MFHSAQAFNVNNLSGWNVSAVINMAYMFYGARDFNGDVSGWDVSNIIDMSYMFYNAYAFDGDVSGWDVSRLSSYQYGSHVLWNSSL